MEKVSSVVFRKNVLCVSEIFCFVLRCSILIDRKWHKVYFDEVFYCLSCGLRETRTLLFPWWMSRWSDFCLYALTKKRINRLFLFFHQHTSCLFIFVVSWIDKTGSIQKLIFNNFFQINEFLQKATQFQEEQSEVPLEGLHAFVHLLDIKELVHLYS